MVRGFLFRTFAKNHNRWMKIRLFPYGYRDGWEVNFIGKIWRFRVARHQIGLWRDYNQVFNKLF